MWTAAGTRITEQDTFQNSANEHARAMYRKHAMGNSLHRNLGGNRFQDETAASGTGVGRWAWSSDAWDFDHDGFPDLYITNGMISGKSIDDLNSFFWRQVVANSPQDSKANRDYEQGWNAINELIRADGTWSGFERNVFYRNNGDGTFSDVSGVVGLDFIEDSRTFALADFDHDGRIEVLLKNRSGPQIRMLKNVVIDLSPAIAFRLQGTKSNRDAIGAAITIEGEAGQQTLLVHAGSGFLAQHSKELFFGVGRQKGPIAASIRWPSGLVQRLDNLPINHVIWVEEGSSPSQMKPFGKVNDGTPDHTVQSTTRSEEPEMAAETWLLVPVAAPDFTIPDLNGKQRSLSSEQGGPVLLYFWSAASQNCKQDLQQFQQSQSRWAQEGWKVIAINADESTTSLNSYKDLSFPVLQATSDMLAIYNILFRSLFDRHRDMDLPCSFLIDCKGAIVKIYQGQIPPEHFERDGRNIPQNVTERLAKALPFPGVIGNYEFGRNYLSYGSLFFERGYPEQAETFFQLVLRDDPSSSEAYYGLASVYLEQQKLQEARKGFERAVQLHPSYPGTLPRAWNNLGIVAARQGRTEEAISNFQQSLKIDSNYSVALDNLGNAYRQGKQWDDAKRAFVRALALNPQDAEANYGLGMVFAQLNDPEHAYEYLKNALAARPVYPEALNNLGVLYLRTQRPEDAEKSFRESIRVAPLFDQSYLNLARLYSMEGDPGKARAVLLDLLKQRPGHSQAEKELAQLPK
jgi:tetratricopeptide (TPR) repeat protein